ncbi:MAG: Ig-like domain-containing protein [Actinomycetota bacterium]|nr:Ig-like domain-containing protein [Actinomycetota bacterium]
MTESRYRWVSLVLGLACLVIASVGVLTATRGPDAVTNPLAAPLPPPPPSVQVTIAAGTLSIQGTEAGMKEPINPTTPVRVSVTHGVLRDVQFIDARSHQAVPGALDPDGRSWHSSAPLAYSGNYQLTTNAVGEDQREVRSTTAVSTLTPAKLSVASFIPSPTSGSVGVGQPLVVRFSRPVGDKAAAERVLKVTTSPSQLGSWYWMSATEAHYRGASYWAPGTTITLAANLFGVDLGNKVFGQANRTETVHIHDSWVAKADGGTKQMQILHNGALVKTMPISLGSPKNPSHEGPHVVSDKRPSVIMDSCTYGVCKGEAGYYKEKVDLDERISSDGEFVHSAPWSVRQQGSSNVSHGCVNLAPANASWFYSTFGIGDVVEITHSGGPPLPVWDTYGDWVLPWAQWQAGSAAS